LITTIPFLSYLPVPVGWVGGNTVFQSFFMLTTTHPFDLMVPVISAATSMIYVATKENGNYVYLGLDWETGEERAR
jgi:hypothetical protein